MPPRRIVEPAETCTLHVDGEPVEARVGEPVAVALAASGRLVLGRSVKYHRPRGAACYAGRCDGCLMRVDGLSSVMTCTTASRDGMVVETQNVVGSARHDLLAATDWFFPRGMDHHHMFTWSKPVNEIMQKIARRIAGIGRLPDQTVAPVPAREEEVDVLVVGGGPTGLVAATECARAGHRVVLADEEGEPGGHLAFLPGEVEDHERIEVAAFELGERLAADARAAGVEIALEHAVIAVYDHANSELGKVVGAAEHTVVALGPRGLVLYRPKKLVVATGAHEGSQDLPGNDAPGVLGVRAASRLLSYGVLPGEHVAIVGETHWARALGKELREHGIDVLGPLPTASVHRIRSNPEVSAIQVTTEGREKRVACDAVALAGLESGAYEIGSQAGVEVRFDGEGFFLVAGGDGATAAPWVRAVGQCTGVRSLPDGIRQAREAGRALASELGGSRG